MNRLQNLLAGILNRYPELNYSNIIIRYTSLEDAYAQYWYEENKFVIEMDHSVRFLRDSIKTAVIASELSHIVKEAKLRRQLKFLACLWDIFDHLLYDYWQRYRNKDEKETDLETLKRGFGKELLELLIHEEDRGEDEEYETHEGLTSAELLKIMQNSSENGCYAQEIQTVWRFQLDR